MRSVRQAVDRVAEHFHESWNAPISPLTAVTMEQYYAEQAVAEVVEEALSCKCGRPLYIESRCKMCHDVEHHRRQVAERHKKERRRAKRDPAH